METFRHLTGIAVISFLSTQILGAQDFFYTYNGEKINLDIAADRFVIQLNPQKSEEQALHLLAQKFGPLNGRKIRGIKSSEFYEIHLKESQGNLDQFQQGISSIRRDGYWKNVAPVFLLHGQKVLTYDVFMVKLANESAFQDLLDLNAVYNIEFMSRNPVIPEIVRLRLAPSSGYTVTEMARLYYETFPLIWSTPDFIPEITPSGSPDDPYFDYQFYLQQIQVEDAWKISKGTEDVIVAVIDDGVTSHEDLPESRLEDGYDAFNETSGAPGGNQAHGMAVAGIIAATHNNLGIAGIAPNTRILPVRIFDMHGGGTSISELEDAISWSATYGDADIINNSWSFAPFDPTSSFYLSLTETIEHIASAHSVVFASGNVAGGALAYPANIDNVIAVGAVDEDDVVFSWSGGTGDFGSLDLVAPSGEPSIDLSTHYCSSTFPSRPKHQLVGPVWTLDIPGDAGYNPGDDGISSPTCYTEFTWSPHAGQPTPNVGYTSHFGGTSAAAPQVSGTIALILSINPFNITRAEIVDILHNSADKVAGMESNNHTNRYGYGRLNVYKALKYTIEHYGALLGREQPQVTLPLWEDITFHEDVYLASGSSMTIEAHNTVTLSSASGNVTIGIPWSLDKSIGNTSRGSRPNLPEHLPQPGPERITLHPNYPNPFNPTTVIGYRLSETGHVRLTVHDILGREVAVLADGHMSAGEHSATFDGSGLASGIYLYRLETPSGMVIRKMTLIK